MAATKTAQRKAHAKAAAARADARRKKAAGGASGWVAERAGDWSLDDIDLDFIAKHKYAWNSLCDLYFRMEISGWQRIPEPPCLLIGIHSGAPFVWDAWTVGMQWWRNFGPDRMLHGTAHDALTAMPAFGAYLRRMGVLPAAPDSIAAALAAKRDVILWPGGDVDSLRPWSERDKVVLGGRHGFVRMALGAKVPIVPIATIGGADAMPVLTRGTSLVSWLGLDKLARLRRFPLALAAPYGIAPAALPEIPLPTKIRTEFQEPIDVDGDPGDDELVEETYERVRDTIQAGMDRLARQRRFPLFG